MVDPNHEQEPAEGSRETIDRELARQGLSEKPTQQSGDQDHAAKPDESHPPK